MKKNKYQVDYNLEEFEEFELERDHKKMVARQQRKGKIFFWICCFWAMVICGVAIVLYKPF